MSAREPSDNARLYLRLLGVAVLLVITAVLGLILGRLSVRDLGTGIPAPETQVAQKTDDTLPPAEEVYIDPESPPLFFLAGGIGQADPSIPLTEIALAAKAGIHQYFVPVPAPWTGDEGLAEVALVIERVIAANPKAALLLLVDLDPPEIWLEAHPDARMICGGKPLPQASPASQEWREAASAVMETLVSGMTHGPYHDRIMGYMPQALRDGRWLLENEFDTSEANRKGFRDWLRHRYVDDGALRSAWGDAGVIFDTASILVPPEDRENSPVFYTRPEDQPIADFLLYASESVADALAMIAGTIRQANLDTLILAPYGYSFEIVSNHAGHFALGALLESDIDGFVSPVSYIDRGRGGAGGWMGPVHSAQYHGKTWHLIDDMRTGVGRDPLSGEITRIKGLRPEDIYEVQRRNFAAALINGLGLVWSDPLGEGWLHDDDQWREFETAKTVYRQVYPPLDTTPDSDDPPADIPEASPVPGTAPGAVPRPPLQQPAYLPGLTLVVDENSRAYQRTDIPLNEWLLHHARDAVLRTGVSAHFCLLQDVLDDVAPPAPIYLFVNTFKLSGRDRARLHARLAREQACAIWLYAPGYINDGAGTANVGATVKMDVRAFDKPGKTGSQFMLAGPWMSQDQAFGATLELAPLFYIEDDETDVLAQFTASQRPSVAMRSLDDGWTSVYIAEPGITPALLREIFRILEQHLYIRPTANDPCDPIYAGNNLIAIHGKQAGDRILNLGGFFDVQDLFDSAIGWPEKESFLMPIRMGETRLLQLSPLTVPAWDPIDIPQTEVDTELSEGLFDVFPEGEGGLSFDEETGHAP